MIEKVLAFLSQNVENYRVRKYLLAVSGGVDSMVLLDLWQRALLNFEVCHVNFQLRGEESEADQRFVEQFCQQNGIILHVVRADTLSYAKEKDFSLQEAARAIRYEAFQNLCQQRNLEFIITAHHLNDVVETLLYSLVKASYHQVWYTIPALHRNVLRPLLAFPKAEIVKYACQHAIPYREDSSNLKNDYHRNKIRNQVIPILKQIQPNLETFLQLKWENYERKERLIFRHFEKIYCKSVREVHPKVFYWHCSAQDFENEEEMLLFTQFLIERFFLKVISDAQLLQLWKCSQKGKVLMDKEWVVLKERKGISIMSKQVWDFEEVLVIEQSGVYEWNAFRVVVPSTWPLPVKIRRWQKGDRWKGKKLSDYLTKKQYPAWQKKIAYVIESPSGELIQVANKLE